jgi:hypothetical protein
MHLSFLHKYTGGIANGCGIYSKGQFIRKVLTALTGTGVLAAAVILTATDPIL